MTQEITVQQREILLSTICKGVSETDFLFMLELAKKYQLDPFAKQIYATRAGIIISRDGYLAIAHKTGNFDGMRTTFEHDKNGNIISSTTTVWRKDVSHPFTETAYWSEYAKDTNVWKQYRHAMMQKCSERMALSKAYAITGLYAEEELSKNPQPPVDTSRVQYMDVEPLPVEALPDPNPMPKAEPEPTPEPVKMPKHIYTKEQTENAIRNMRTLGMNTEGLMERARMEDGLYNGDIITEEWQKQTKGVPSNGM